MLRNILRNFWFCLSMAVFSLLALWSAVLDDELVWIWIDVFCVVYWVHAAYRNSKQPLQDLHTELSPEYRTRLNIITRKFSRDLDELLKEADEEESNKRKDKEADKKEPSDE